MAHRRPEADDLVHEIGQRILTDESYAERGWTGIALVIEVGTRQRMYGFVYTADDWEAETPHDFDIITRTADLAQLMADDGDHWTRCLVQITRPQPTVTIRFDVTGTADWAVTPSNHAEMVEKLRP